MFTFSPDVPANIQAFLVSLLQAWVDRKDQPVYRVETTRYGLVSFIRSPWPASDPTLVSPFGEVDLASLQAYSNETAAAGGTHVVF